MCAFTFYLLFLDGLNDAHLVLCAVHSQLLSEEIFRKAEREQCKLCRFYDSLYGFFYREPLSELEKQFRAERIAEESKVFNFL